MEKNVNFFIAKNTEKNPEKSPTTQTEYRGLKFHFDSDCAVFTSMSSAIEVLLNIAETVIINTAKITVVSFNPPEDDLRIFIYPIFLKTY